MFERLFRYPAVAARHRAGPFAEARERFLHYCASRGFADRTLQRCAQELLVVAERLDIASNKIIELRVVEAAADQWAREQRQQKRARDLRWSRGLFIQTAKDWLQFLGILEMPKPQAVAFAERLADFAAYRRNERGLSPTTVHGQNWHLQEFFVWLGEHNRNFSHLCLEDVDGFLAGKGKAGLGRVSLATSAKALRAFFNSNMRLLAGGVRPISRSV